MQTSSFNYDLPKSFIAQDPASPRDHSKLMILNKNLKTIEHKHFYDLPEILNSNDVLVFNKSMVIPARLFATANSETSKPYEIFLLKQIDQNNWTALVKPGKKFKLNNIFQILEKDKKRLSNTTAIVKSINSDGSRNLEFTSHLPDTNVIPVRIGQGGQAGESPLLYGHPPLPPYITKNQNDYENSYQTIYADENAKGSVAAPTAGLHFTEELLKKLKNKNIQTEFVTLHVGLGTFLPVKADNIKDHKMHSEWFSIDKETAKRLNSAKKQGKRIIAIGTTSVRVLESCTDENGILKPKTEETNIFIYPGYKFKFINSLITNFHLPKSTLLMLVSALAEKDFIFKAYKEAIKKKYRFYSFGDAMIIK